MSTTIDHQVVEMRFDNKHFEQNVSTTMSTLDKFKQKLNMSDAAKGLENVNVAAKNVDLSSIGNSAEKVGLKFNALYTIADQAFRNITNSAYYAGKNIVKSLTIEPVTTGFNEYELKMGSIQTIMAGTGESLETVNRYLNELNEYSDKTIYSFKDMTSNIGKFTNAGVSLEDAVLAIKGISNEAALSGANANEASRAMYNFSQALSAGFVKLIDWKSIELANMATKDFKEQLIQTAVEVGTLKKGADGMYDVVNVISKANATSLNATKNFNDSLGNQWMTTEVLIETLRKYADETSDIGKKATAAATEVKTFTMMMDTLKEAAQSGWAQTWELFVGDFEEAKAFFTELSDIFGGIIGDSADRRNAFFGDALTSNWDKLLDKLEKAGIKAEDFEEAIRKQSGSETHIDALVKKYGSLGKAIQDGAIATEILQKAFDNIFESKAGKTVESFVEGLKEIKRLLKYDSVGEDVKKLQTALDSLGYDLGKPGIDGIIGPITEAAIKAFQKDHNIEVDGIVGPETLAALEAAGTKVNELEGDVDDLKSSCKDLIKVVTQKSGRELLLNSLLNIITAIRKPLGAVGKAFGKIFDIKPTQLYNLIENFNRLTKALIINDETAEKLQKTFEGIFSVLKIVSTIAGGAFSIAFKLLMAILEKFNIGFLDLTASLGEGLTKISEFINGAIKDGIGAAIDWVLPKITALIEALKRWVTGLKETRVGKEFVAIFENWPKTLEKISDAFDTCVKAIQGWIEELRNTQLYKDVSGWFSGIGTAISNSVSNIRTSISNIDFGGFSDAYIGVKNFFGGLYENLKQNKFVIAAVDGIKNAFGEVKDFFGKFKLPEFNIDNMKTFSTDIAKIGEKVEGLGGSGFGGAISGFFQHLKDNVISWNWTVFKESAIEKFTTFYLKMGDKIKAAFEKCKEIMTAIKVFIFGSEDVKLPDIIELGKKILEVIVLIEAIKALQKIVAPLDNITSALDNVAASMKWNAMSGMFKSMALALGVFTVCLIIISQIPAKDATRAAITLGALMVVLGGVVAAIGFFASKINGGLNTAGAVASLLMLVGSIAILVYTLKEIEKLDLKRPGKTFAILGGILLALTAGVAMISKAAGTSFRSVAAILTLMAALKLILDVLDAYDQYDWIGKSDAIKKMVEMMLVLVVGINLMSRGIKAGASASGLAFAILAMVLSLKIIAGAIEDFAAIPEESFKKGGVAVAAVLGFMTVLMAVANLTNKGIKLDKGQKAVNNFTGFAVALLAVVAAIWLLGKMAINNEAVLKKGATIVAAILASFTAMFGVIGKTCSGLKMGSIWSMLIGVVAVVAAMSAAIYILRDVPWQTSIGVAAAMSIVILSMATALKSLSKYDIYSGNIWHWVGAMAALAVIMVGLGHVIKACRDVNPGTALGVATSLSIILGAMALSLLTLTKYDVSSGNIRKWVPAMAAMTVVVGLLAFVLYNAKDISAVNALGVAGGLAITLGAVALAIGILSTVKVNAAAIWKWIPALAAMSAVIGLLAFVLYNMDGMDSGNAIGNATALSELLIVLGGVMTVVTAMSKFANPTGMLAGVLGIGMLGLVVWELGGILNKMKTYDLANMMDDVLTLSVLLIVLTGVLAALTGLGTILAGGSFLPAAGLAAALAGLALLGLIVWELGGILNKMKAFGLGGMMDDVKVLSTLLVVLTGVMVVLSVFGMLSAGAFVGIAGIAALGLVVWELGAILNAMKTYGIGNMMPDVKVLSTLLITLTGVLAILSIIGVLGIGAFAGILGIAALGLVVWELGGILNAMKSFELGGMMDDVKVLSTLLIVLTGVFATLAIIGVLGVGALVGVVGLAALGLVLWELGAIINAMKSYDLGSAMPMVVSLLLLVEGLTAILVQLAVVGPLAAVGVTALQGLLLVIMELAGFVGAIGLLMDKLPFLEDFLDKGIGVFVKLAGGLGQIIGAFIEGSVGSIVDSLVQLATGLSDFAKNITGFVDAMADIDPSIGEGVQTLCGAILAITGANMLEAITSIFGGNDLGAFGKSVADFAVCIKDAATALGGITDDDVANIERSARAGVAMSDLANSIPKSGGVWQEWTGEKNMSQFGQTLVEFGDCIVEYSKKVSSEDFNTEAITASAEAGKSLADVANAIPSSGGVWNEWIAGERSLAQFGETVIAFGNALVGYNALVTTETFNPEAIKASASAGAALAEVANAIPSSGGIWNEWIAGEHDLAEFGNQLITFGEGILAYSSVAVQLTDDKIAAIKNSGTAIDEIKKVMEKVPEKANWWDNLWGNNQDGGSFGEAITAVANGINRFCTVAVSIADKTDSISNVGTAIDNVNTVLGKIPDEETIEKTTGMKTAVEKLNTIANILSALTAAGHDYSGLTTLRTAITWVKNMFSGIDTSDLFYKYSDLKSTADKLVKAANSIVKLNGYTYEGVDRFRDAVKTLKGLDIAGLTDLYSGMDTKIKETIGSVIAAMRSAIASNADEVSLDMVSLMNVVVDKAMSKRNDFRAVGVECVSKLGTGLMTGVSSLDTVGENLTISAASGAKKGYTGMYNAGAYLVAGFVKGIDDNDYKAAAQAKAMAEIAVAAAKAALRINSPSKVFREIGYSIPEGFAMGIDRMGWMVKDSTVAMGNLASRSLSSTIARISYAINTDIDTQPTIRPVLDLSNVQAGAGAIGNLLGGDASIGVLSNVGTISTMMNRRSQNGSNDDVILALDRLGKKMDNINNASYHIDGITYDDGSNISDAVKTIVRAAKMERRV